jgi:hypothetical protein
MFQQVRSVPGSGSTVRKGGAERNCKPVQVGGGGILNHLYVCGLQRVVGGVEGCEGGRVERK